MNNIMLIGATGLLGTVLMNELKLIPVEEKHLETIRQWRMKPNITKNMFTDPIISSEEQKQWYHSIIHDNSRRIWLIIYDDKPIGVCQIEKIDYRNKNCFWGCYIGEEEQQGKGIGKLLECNMYDYIFDNMMLHKVCGEVFDWNHQVISLHVRHGCYFEGVFKEQIFKDDIYYNVVRLGLLKEDWLKLRDSLNYQKIEITDMEDIGVFGTCDCLEEVFDKDK